MTYGVYLDLDEKPLGEAEFKVLCPCSAVGGCVQSPSTFALLSLWIVAVGLAGCIGNVVAVVAKRRRK